MIENIELLIVALLHRCRRTSRLLLPLLLRARLLRVLGPKRRKGCDNDVVVGEEEGVGDARVAVVDVDG